MTEIQCSPHPEGPQIANTIKRQIGLDAWLAVSGRNPRWWTDSTGNVVFAFRFGSRYGLARWCEITYQSGSDDYDLVAYRVRRNGMRQVIASAQRDSIDFEEFDYDGVYADNLGSIIRRANLTADLL